MSDFPHKVTNIGLGRVGCVLCNSSWDEVAGELAPAECVHRSMQHGDDETYSLGDTTHDMDTSELLPHTESIPNFLRKENAVMGDQSAIPVILDEARDTFRDRNAAYGASYKRYGALLLALFPEGGIPAITTEEDANRLAALMDCAGKLHRYANNFANGGHKDSAHDLIVYAAMLEEAT